MFVRRPNGLLEFTMAALCLWTAWHHTPLGAALRRGSAWVFGVRSDARPLLAYYSGGGGRDASQPLPVGRFSPPATPELALATALHASLRQLPPPRRTHAQSLARAHAIDPEALLDTSRGPALAAALIEKASRDSGGEEGAVLASFIGREPVRYAAQRVQAEGNDKPKLEDLARHLPPGFESEVLAASDTLAVGVALGLSWPVAESTRVSSGFGDREHPVLGGVRMHTGVDLPLPVGSPIRAVGEGRVRRASEDSTNGRMLVLDHGRGVTSAYLHNSELLVGEGDEVKRGQVISRSGNTGRSTGPHLHYQLEIAERPVDPLAFRGCLTPITVDAKPMTAGP